jgi:hypothetical protein
MNNLLTKIDIVVQVLRILGFKTIVHVLGKFLGLNFSMNYGGVKNSFGFEFLKELWRCWDPRFLTCLCF